MKEEKLKYLNQIKPKQNKILENLRKNQADMLPAQKIQKNMVILQKKVKALQIKFIQVKMIR